MIILVDMDGPLANFEKGFLDKWRRKYSDETYVALKDRKDFYIESDYPKTLVKKIQKIFLSPGFFLSLEPVSGAIESINLMRKLGHDVYICTAPYVNTTCGPEKWIWVEKYLGKEWLSRLIITRDKTLVRGNILIDDKPNIIGRLSPIWEHILFDEPYNRKTPDHRKRLNWSNWRTVLKI